MEIRTHSITVLDNAHKIKKTYEGLFEVIWQGWYDKVRVYMKITDKAYPSIYHLEVRFTQKPVGVLGDEERCEEARALNVPYIDEETLRTIGNVEGCISKLVLKYAAFVVSESLLDRLPFELRPALRKLGKRLVPLYHEDSLAQTVERVKNDERMERTNAIGCEYRSMLLKRRRQWWRENMLLSTRCL